MQTGGMSRRLINLANVLVGWFRGGLGSVSVLTSMFLPRFQDHLPQQQQPLVQR